MRHFNINMHHMDTASLQVLLPEPHQIAPNFSIPIVRVNKYDVVCGPAVALVVDVLADEENGVADQRSLFGADGVDHQHLELFKTFVGCPIRIEGYVRPNGDFSPMRGENFVAFTSYIRQRLDLNLEHLYPQKLLCVLMFLVVQVYPCGELLRIVCFDI